MKYLNNNAFVYIAHIVPQYSQMTHHSLFVRVSYEFLFFSSLNYVLILLSLKYVQFGVILDRDMSRVACIDAMPLTIFVIRTVCCNKNRNDVFVFVIWPLYHYNTACMYPEFIFPRLSKHPYTSVVSCIDHFLKSLSMCLFLSFI